MPKAPKTIVEISHAEAWVDTMPVQPTKGGTLHVVAQLKIIQGPVGQKMVLRKAEPQGINAKILQLDIVPSNLMIYMFNPQHLAYTEGLKVSDEYSSIDIQFNGKKLATVSNIPIIK